MATTNNVILDVKVSGEEGLDRVDKLLKGTTTSGKKAVSAITELRKEMKDAKSDMLKYAEGTNEYNAAMKRAAEGADKMADINGKLKASQRDVGILAKNVAGAVSGLAGGFAAAQGVIGLFGVESDKVTQTLLKMQSVLNITQGLANFVDAFDSMKDLYGAVKLRILESVAAKDADTIATNANTIAVEANSVANATNVGSINNTNKAVTELSDSTNNLGKESAVVASNLAGGVIANENYRKSLLDQKEIISELYKDQSSGLKEVQVLQEDGSIKMEKVNDLITEQERELKNLEKTQNSHTNSLGNSAKAFGKNILQMGLYAIAIGGVILIISKLIELLNEVPEDVKIKIEIETEAINQTKKLREDINKFQSDYVRATREHNTEQLKNLDEIAKKEYGLSDERLKTIKSTADGWSLFFTEYLKLAEATYYNESLIKKKVDLQMQQDTAKNQLESIKESGKISEDQFKTLTKLAKNKNIIAKVGSDIFSFGLEQDVLDATRAVDEIEKKLKDLDRLKPKEVANYFNISKTTGTTETKTVKQNVQFGQFTMPDVKQVQEYLDKLEKPKVEFKPFILLDPEADAQYELKKLNKLYDKGKLTTEEYLQSKYDLLKFAEDRGIDLTETAYNVQAQIVENAEAKKRAAIQKTINTVQASLDTATSITDALGALNQAELDSENAKYDKKSELIEQDYYNKIEKINKSSMTEEEKTKALEELDNQRLAAEEKNEEDRYKMQVKNLEFQKKIQIAQAWINAASGVLGIWSRSWEGGLFGGPILAGIQSAALIALAAAQTKAISAQRIDAPIKTSASKASSSSSSSVNMVNAKLNPNKTSLTTSEENIGMINASNQKNTQAVVKVSDINNVQKTVAVRDNNTQY